jgi:hypothetical protein
MKPLAHFAGFSLALVLAGLGSGCSSTTSTSTYSQPAQDFEVVESSANRPLTDTEMSEVRSSVASFLDREGATDSGDYFLKVYLTPENMDAEPEWVVVRFTRYTAQRVALVSAYTYDGLMYSPYYAYDIYPYGYGCVSRISFQYYVDPFYNRRYYHYPRYGYGGRKGGHHHDANNHGKPGRPGDGHGPGNGDGPGNGPNRPSGPKYTGNRPPMSPLAENTPTRYNRNNPNTPAPRQDPEVTTGNFRERRENSNNTPGQRRGRANDAGPSGLVNGGSRPGSTSPNVAPVQANPIPTPERYRPPNPGSTAANQAGGNQPGQWRNRTPNSNPSPTGVNNAQRTADRVAPAGNRPSQANRPQQANRPSPSYRPAVARPAPSSQPAPARASAPSYQAPARSAPAAPSRDSGGRGRGGDRQGGDSQREALR